MSLTDEIHPFQATVEGRFLIQAKYNMKYLAEPSSVVHIGPAFSITMADNCCEEHAALAAKKMLMDYAATMADEGNWGTEEWVPEFDKEKA